MAGLHVLSNTVANQRWLGGAIDKRHEFVLVVFGEVFVFNLRGGEHCEAWWGGGEQAGAQQTERTPPPPPLDRTRPQRLLLSRRGCPRGRPRRPLLEARGAAPAPYTCPEPRCPPESWSGGQGTPNTWSERSHVVFCQQEGAAH